MCAATRTTTTHRPGPTAADRAAVRRPVDPAVPPSVWDTLEPLLGDVSQPAQYVGGEHNMAVTPWAGARTRWLLCYPDTYAIGQPNQGIQILYELLNERATCLAERAYAPWFDLEELMRERSIPTFSLEHHYPLWAFDVFGVTLPHELGHTNLLNLLDLGGVPVHAEQRSVASGQRRRFERQLPDTLNLLATSLRAGYSMLQAIDAVAEESPDPAAREFRRVLNEIRLGRSVGEAMQDSARRMESVDFDWVVLAFTIQREVGGNLAEVLHTTSETILARGRLRGEMHALTAEGRISAFILGAMPFLLFGFLYLTNRDYLEPLLSSSIGIPVLVGAFALLAIGLFWINRLIKVEV